MTVEMIQQQEDQRLSPGRAARGALRPRLAARCCARTSARAAWARRRRAGDGVIAGAGRVDGRPVFCFAQDPSFVGGSLGEQHADSIVRVLRLAGRAGAPVVGFIESGGARMQEGIAALAGYGRIFREHVALSRRGPADLGDLRRVGRRRLLLARADRLRGHDRAREHVPHRPRASCARSWARTSRADELGGHKVHERNGVATSSPTDDADAALLVRDLLDHLPATQRRARAALARGRPGRLRPGRAGAGRRARASTTCATSSAAIVDGGRLLECGAPSWARNIVCGFARIDGRAGRRRSPTSRSTSAACSTPSPPPRARASCAPATRSGCRSSCSSTRPGFMPGTRQEEAGVIRHGAKLVHAFAEATVPRVTVVLRKAFGGAFIAMNSRDLGADYVFAWPQRPARRHGRQAGGRRSSTAATSPPPTTRTPRATRSPPTTPTST